MSIQTRMSNCPQAARTSRLCRGDNIPRTVDDSVHKLVESLVKPVDGAGRLDFDLKEGGSAACRPGPARWPVIVTDIKDPSDAVLLRRILARADVFIQTLQRLRSSFEPPPARAAAPGARLRRG